MAQNLIYRAGLIPYYIEPDGTVMMMFMKPSNPEYGGFFFQLAKGKVEDGETNLVAALREAQEEIGLFRANVLRTEEVGTFMGRTAVFVSKIRDRDLFAEPSFETAAASWMSLDEFLEIGRDLHKPVVRACYEKILEMEGMNG